MNTTAVAPENGCAQARLREFLFYFLRLGTHGFGGPIAVDPETHTAYTLRSKKWAEKQRREWRCTRRT
jgi:chromate transport protein ChrA